MPPFQQISRAPHGAPYDVAIVGGGPAGLSAAIWLGRYLHRVVLIDSGDPRNWETRGINGYLGLPGIKPAELRGAGREECKKYDVKLLILDSLGPAFEGDTEAARDVIGFFQKRLEPFRAIGVTILMIDHQARVRGG